MFLSHATICQFFLRSHFVIQLAVSKSTWLQHLGDKCHEVLQVNAKSMQGVSDSRPFATDGYGGPTAALDVSIIYASPSHLITVTWCDSTQNFYVSSHFAHCRSVHLVVN